MKREIKCAMFLGWLFREERKDEIRRAETGDKAEEYRKCPLSVILFP